MKFVDFINIYTILGFIVFRALTEDYLKKSGNIFLILLNKYFAFLEYLLPLLLIVKWVCNFFESL